MPSNLHITTSEARLMSCFETTLALDRPYSRFSGPIVFHEFAGVQGRADLVVAYINTQALPTSISLSTMAAIISSPTNARILATLPYRNPRTWTYLTRLTGLSKRRLRCHIYKMADLGILELSRTMTVSLTCRLPWNMVDIVAYEGKLFNWKKALHQALGYKSFARSVQIVMPHSSAQRAKSLEVIFRTHGIGLVSLDPDSSPKIEIPPKTHRRPANRRLYLMAAGAILRRGLELDQTLESYIDLESSQSI